MLLNCSFSSSQYILCDEQGRKNDFYLGGPILEKFFFSNFQNFYYLNKSLILGGSDPRSPPPVSAAPGDEESRPTTTLYVPGFIYGFISLYAAYLCYYIRMSQCPMAMMDYYSLFRNKRFSIYRAFIKGKK